MSNIIYLNALFLFSLRRLKYSNNIQEKKSVYIKPRILEISTSKCCENSNSFIILVHNAIFQWNVLVIKVFSECSVQTWRGGGGELKINFIQKYYGI